MNKLAKIAALLFLVALICAPVAAFAQDAAATDAAEQAVAASSLTPLYGIGVGLTIFGAALGIARIGASSVENMARQPEVAGKINTAMIISAALIEGVTFFALIVCMMK
ncbi:MAG: ATP synthase F0 subunit C [Planctomycetia bacterium]|nr:ATP synthase F0 subunit C [Planctomycetia bacterium]